MQMVMETDNAVIKVE